MPHLATPSAVECDLDEDDDGLDDEVEAVIAECFVPELRFDVDEPALESDARFPGGSEPFVAFNV